MSGNREHSLQRSSTSINPKRTSYMPKPSPGIDNKTLRKFVSHEDLKKSHSATEALVKEPQPQQVDESENYSAYFARYQILIEFACLRDALQCPSGMYVMPALNNINLWYGVLFVHKGYYSDAILKFQIDIPNSYPNLAPTVTFITDTFHPLIDQKGSFNLSARFSSWTRHHHVLDILKFIKESFKQRYLDTLIESDCYNLHSYKLYKDELHLFKRLAQQCAKVSATDSVVFDDFPVGNPIQFKPIDDKNFDEMYSRMLGPNASILQPSTSRSAGFDDVLSNLKKSVSTNFNKFFEQP